jgi:cytochrome P450
VRSRWERFLALHRVIDKAIVELVRDRRRAPGLLDRHDILSKLAAATDDSGALLDEAVVRDHLLTLVLAGHDTTATALGWAFDLLAHHPLVAEKLVRELRDGDDQFLDAFIKEVFRIRPVIPEVARVLTAPVDISGVRVPAGHSAAANIHLAHQCAETYPDPTEFRPERFLGAPADPYGWLPFGGGIRRCIGVAFATLEMRTVLRTVVPSFSVHPARRRPVQPRRRAVTLIPRYGAPVVLVPRRDSSNLPAAAPRKPC